MAVVGDAAELGAWKLEGALALDWAEGDLWSATLSLPKGQPVEFKFVILGEDGKT